MARSHQSQYSPKVAKKAFREAAKTAGVRYIDAINAKNEDAKDQKYLKLTTTADITCRNPRRMDGMQWNGDSFVCFTQVDGTADDLHYDSDVDYEGPYDDYYNYHSPKASSKRHSQNAISLLDIAKPMKVKGIAKDFEVVKSVDRIIALDEDIFEVDFEMDAPCADGNDSDSDWEDLFERETEVKIPAKYSDVIKAREKT